MEEGIKEESPPLLFFSKSFFSTNCVQIFLHTSLSTPVCQYIPGLRG